MNIFNPPTNLGGSRIEESQDNLTINPETSLYVTSELGEVLLEKYPFLKEVDESYGPDYHETLYKKRSWWKRIWH